MSFEDKLTTNFYRVKEKLAPSWRFVKDIAYQKGIIVGDDMDRIDGMSVEKDKIDLILRKASKLKKVDILFKSLGEIENGTEFQQLYREISETDIPKATSWPATGSLSFSDGKDQNFVNAVAEAIKEQLEPGLANVIEKKIEECVEKHENRRKEEDAKRRQDKEKKRKQESEELLKHIDSKFRTMEISQTNYKAKYEEMRQSYSNARKTIDEKQRLAKQKHLEYFNLKKNMEKSDKEHQRKEEELRAALEIEMKKLKHSKEQLQRKEEELEAAYKQLEKVETEKLDLEKKIESQERLQEKCKELQDMIDTIQGNSRQENGSKKTNNGQVKMERHHWKH